MNRPWLAAGLPAAGWGCWRGLGAGWGDWGVFEAGFAGFTGWVGGSLRSEAVVSVAAPPLLHLPVGFVDFGRL